MTFGWLFNFSLSTCHHWLRTKNTNLLKFRPSWFIFSLSSLFSLYKLVQAGTSANKRFVEILMHSRRRFPFLCCSLGLHCKRWWWWHYQFWWSWGHRGGLSTSKKKVTSSVLYASGLRIVLCLYVNKFLPNPCKPIMRVWVWGGYLTLYPYPYPSDPYPLTHVGFQTHDKH